MDFVMDHIKNLLDLLGLDNLNAKTEGKDSIDTIISLTTGVTGGLLSLVGLIAIFLSINTQHTIERARQILWELDFFDVDNIKNDQYTARRALTYIKQYRNLVKLSWPIVLVVLVALITLIFVMATWLSLWNNVTSLNISNNNILTKFFFLSSLILLLFFILILLLPVTRWFGGLPKWKDLLDGNQNMIHVLTLLAKTMTIQISYKEKGTTINEIKLTLKNYIPFINVGSSIKMRGYDKDNNSEEIIFNQYDNTFLCGDTTLEMKDPIAFNVKKYKVITLTIEFSNSEKNKNVTALFGDIEVSELVEQKNLLINAKEVGPEIGEAKVDELLVTLLSRSNLKKKQ
jgi:hypothetical protein